jgi:hypothetical protein
MVAGRVEDREHCSSGLYVSQAPALSENGELVNEVVKGRPEIMQTVTSDVAPTGIDWLDSFDPKDVFRSVLVYLDRDFVSVRRHVCGDFLPERFEVLLGPPELAINALHRGHVDSH